MVKGLQNYFDVGKNKNNASNQKKKKFQHHNADSDYDLDYCFTEEKPDMNPENFTEAERKFLDRLST